MSIVLWQSFPLGRFHATPWRANPFTDARGEWPPSPWRLVRAVVARWYQWQRETTTDPDEEQLGLLIRALCTSTYRFHLPAVARRGDPLRQYQPAEFRWNPPEKKKAAVRGYNTSLAQDNFWCVPREDDGAVWWFVDGQDWNDELVAVLDRCLERITYFGRAEAFSLLRRVEDGAPPVNCLLQETRSADSVAVLVPEANATRADVEGITDDPDLAGRSIPKGAKLLHTRLPRRPPATRVATRPTAQREPHLIQLALGWAVPPPLRSVVRLTGRFRGAVLREFFRIKSDGASTSWGGADRAARAEVADMLGKNAEGDRLEGHRHTSFFAWLEGAHPTRILVWRETRPFDDDEQMAILRAAARDLSWAAAGPDAADWKVRVVPLDSAVPAPPGFGGECSNQWSNITPFVPARYHLRGGKPRAGESVVSQVRRELVNRAVIPTADDVEISDAREAGWVSVHVPRGSRSRKGAIGDRRGYWLRLTFNTPVQGPIALGHSSHFGLGLFVPGRGAGHRLSG